MSDDFRVCPSCEEEYTAGVDVCAECGVELVAPGTIVAGADEGFPPVAELDCVRVGPLPWTRALSEALTEAGVGHRVEPDNRTEEEGGIDSERFGGEPLYGTWVKPEDLDEAGQINQAVFGHLEAGEELDEAESEACPACQEALAPDALDCPGCGLSFG